MRKSRLKRQIQDKLIEHFIAGTTARCAAELIGANRKTADFNNPHPKRQLVQLKQWVLVNLK